MSKRKPARLAVLLTRTERSVAIRALEDFVSQMRATPMRNNAALERIINGKVAAMERAIVALKNPVTP